MRGLVHACDDESACDAVKRCPPCGEDSEHDWHGVGGLASNPGVFGGPNTTLSFVERCTHCQVTRTTRMFGSQRDPGQCDRVSYESPGEVES